MHLLIGDSHDSCCVRVRAVLEARHYPTRIMANPFIHPSRFTWRLSSERSSSQLLWDAELPVTDDQITGVLVGRTGWIDPAGWQPDDLAYMQAETQAALLAWLWSLTCPVVNRYPAAIWYHPQVPLLFWQRLLRRCGLPTMETLVTNVEQEAAVFGQRLAQEGVAGAVYGPLTSAARYLVTSSEDWHGLAAMQRYAPVCLTYPHGAAELVCVVGKQVVWNGKPSSEIARLESACHRFVAETGLAFVEMAFASTSQGICVIAVDPYPNIERFCEKARQEIVEGLVHLLTAETG